MIIGHPSLQIVKFIFCILIGPLWAVNAKAGIVKSCDGQTTARVVASRPEFMAVDREREKLGTVKIDHDIVGGVFDSTDKLLIVYGLPNKVDLKNPQAQYLSIYIATPHPRFVMKRTYGGGIYEVAIGVDPNLILVVGRFGFEVINVKTKKVEIFDPLSEPKFLSQRCKSDQ